jgi:hypothetical protein
LVGQINLTNLDAAEPEPTAQSLEWDAIVDTYAELTYINTADLSGTVNYWSSRRDSQQLLGDIQLGRHGMVKDKDTDLQHISVLELHRLVQDRR